MTELNPYVAPEAELDHDFDTDDVELAGLGERFFARLIDWALRNIIFFILFLICLPMLGGWLGAAWGPDPASTFLNDPYEVMLMFFVNFNNPIILYCIVLTHVSFLILQGIPLALWGQTLGKKWMHIAMVDEATHEKVPFFKLLFLRYMACDIPALIFSPLNWFVRLTDLLFGFQNDRRTLHDKLAGTIVIKV